MFLDSETAEALRISEYLKRVAPYTPLGKKWKGRLKPYTLSRVEEWELDLQDQQEIMELFSESRATYFLTCCELVDDIDFTLQEVLQDRSTTLTWFHIKRFLVTWFRWDEFVSSESSPRFMRMNPEEQRKLHFLLLLLQKSGHFTTTFEVSQLGDSKWIEMNRQKNQLTKAIQQLRKERQKQISERLQRNPNFQGEWVISRHQESAKVFAVDPDIKLVRETIYEQIYELVPDKQEHVWQEQLLSFQEKLSIHEQLLFRQINRLFRDHIPFLQSLVQRWTRLDLLWAKCRAAQSWNGVRPVYLENQVRMIKGTLPLEQGAWMQKGYEMTPVTLEMKPGCTLLIGPNMGGKTTALRAVGLCTVLAQYGLYVPAEEFCFPLFPWVRTWIGDHQNAEQGLSSFGAEMNRLAQWIDRDPENQGLILLDEIGRGTNPIEGSAISCAITRYLHESQAWAVHVTHFPEALQIEGIRGYRVRGLSTIPKWDSDYPNQAEDWIRLLYQAMDYHLDPIAEQDVVATQAISIAEICGLPEKVIEQARTAVKQRIQEGDYGREIAFGSTED
ncbi:DNA mismatch repair ATPase MutS [Croceifilum oryzae]|uniref:DNA mismatch repair ATPase MutS n=1 Tax=Croceifilum oryzae TaxID=1553429 RepID=A0AAJ1TK16_9BACL|nr:hypothetical protein [Croceifilum oryzae]MDQ0418327.1 DNA mismatch repair ATPase MutS [Croceifilum oryzae]